jgi:hypothetical protein
LDRVPGIVYTPGSGWSIGSLPAVASAPVAAASEPSEEENALLQDFMVLASDGAGPAGSGGARAVCLLPVLSRQPGSERLFPSGGLDDEPSLAGSGAGGRGGRPPTLQPAELRRLTDEVGDLPIVCHRTSHEVDPVRRACVLAGLEFHPRVVSVARLGHLLLGLKRNHPAVALADALRIEVRGPDDCRGRARIVAGAFLRLLPILEERGLDSLDTILEFQEMPPVPLDLSGYDFSEEEIRSLPTGPGVYLFRDREGRVLYVGKGKNLRARVGSYFRPSARNTEKGRALLERIRSFEITPVRSDLEAQLLEAALIAEHRPPLNRQFDVHERPTPYGPRLNLIVVLPDATPEAGVPETCTLHMLREGRYLGRVLRVAPSTPDGRRRHGKSHRSAGRGWTDAGDRVGRGYFSRRRARDCSTTAAQSRSEPTPIDVDWELVGSYLRRNQDLINVLDVDECATLQEAIGRLKVLVGAACSQMVRVVTR